MFVDVLWANLVVFAVGQLVAVGYLRTGRFWLGMVATAALWAMLDWWLVGRFLFASDAAAQRLPVLGLQATALSVAVAWSWAQLRRRAARGTRTLRHREGVQQLLRGDAAAAVLTFRGLVWSDPWDASAWVALGDSWRRTGELRRARRAYRRAEAVDVGGAFSDLLGHRRALLLATSRSAPARRPESLRPESLRPDAGGAETGGGAVGTDGATGAVTPGPQAATVSPAAARGARKQAR